MGRARWTPSQQVLFSHPPLSALCLAVSPPPRLETHDVHTPMLRRAQSYHASRSIAAPPPTDMAIHAWASQLDRSCTQMPPCLRVGAEGGRGNRSYSTVSLWSGAALRRRVQRRGGNGCCRKRSPCSQPYVCQAMHCCLPPHHANACARCARDDFSFLSSCGGRFLYFVNVWCPLLKLLNRAHWHGLARARSGVCRRS